MESHLDQFVWAEKYRPTKVADCILPKSIKDKFQGFVDQKNVPTLLECGPPGTGKTTTAIAMLTELDCNFLKIPATLKGGIDVLRTDITNFASSVSFKGTRKYVILDEADYLTHLTQPALRNFIDDYADNCGFIFTANYRNRIIEPLQSRCHIVEFNIGKSDAPQLATQFMHRVGEILDAEHIKYDKATIAALIRKHFPDWRRILNELQGAAAATGEIGPSVLVNARELGIKELIGLMKDNKFSAIRQWAADNVSTDYAQLYREFYDSANEYFKPIFIPELVLLIAKYMTQSSMVFDQEINFVAFATELMIGAKEQWK
jgi:DNA polymerase III delta prime subunit